MGARGPLPKRTKARAGHRAKAELAEEYRVPYVVEPPPAPEDLHPRALRFWHALARSGQSAFFEPSDWELAGMRVRIQSVMETALDAKAVPPANLIGELSKIDARLGVTESDRRRMRVEVERPDAGPRDGAGAGSKSSIQERLARVAAQAGG
jgi:hypothetical protein